MSAKISSSRYIKEFKKLESLFVRECFLTLLIQKIVECSSQQKLLPKSCFLKSFKYKLSHIFVSKLRHVCAKETLLRRDVFDKLIRCIEGRGYPNSGQFFVRVDTVRDDPVLCPIAIVVANL